MSILTALIFMIVGLLGLLAAKRPQTFARYFLAEQQRQRVPGNENALSWTGWVIFGFGLFTSAMIIIEVLISR